MITQSNPERPLWVRIPCGEVTLEGELVIPQGAHGVVVFVHGSGSIRRSARNQSVARIIRDSGNGTLLFELFTAEEEAQDRITGELRFDIELLASRLTEVTRWLSRQPAARSLGIGYCGSSTGGAAALLAAASGQHKIAAVVSCGGRPDLAAEALPKVQAPTLLIVGGRDTPVLQLNDKAFGLLHCKKKLRIVSGETHLFEERGALESVAHLAADWFLTHFPSHPKPNE